jgi:hypothetical protein
MKIILKELKFLKAIQREKKAERNESKCICLIIKKLNRNNKITNLYLKENKLSSSMPFNPFESLC